MTGCSSHLQGTQSLVEEKVVETNNYDKELNAVLEVCSKWSGGGGGRGPETNSMRRNWEYLGFVED